MKRYVPKKYLQYLKAFVKDDLKEIDQKKLLAKVTHNTHFSFSYIVLLISSSIVSTLGLLLDSPAVVIGGMIISPLMWPLMKISVGISYGKQKYVQQAMILLLSSIAVSLLSALFITVVSPLKFVNSEILARTNPTLIDIFVAVASGAVAALGMAQTRISDSLAGVAVATSLMPPLCVSGIGLALLNIGIFAGGFLLFLTNVISIIFISIFTFLFLGLKAQTNKEFRREGIMFISLAMIVIAVPLFIFLINHSFRSSVFQQVEKTLEEELEIISEDINLQNIKTTIKTEAGEDLVEIEADILVPREVVIDYEQRQMVISKLEDKLRRNIELKLLIQNTISLESEEDKQKKATEQALKETFQEEIEKTGFSFTVDSLVAEPDEEKKAWVVESVLRGDPSVQFTDTQRQEIEQTLREASKSEVNLNMEIISRVKLRSEPDLVADQIKQVINEYFGELSAELNVSSISLQSDQSLKEEETEGETESQEEQEIEQQIAVIVGLTAPTDGDVTDEDVDQLQNRLETQFENTRFGIEVRITRSEILVGEKP